MSSRNTKPHQTKQSAGRNVQSAPPRTTKPHHPKEKHPIPASSKSLHVASSKKVSCTTCGKTFSADSELSQHQKDKHGTKQQNRSKQVHATLPSGMSGISSGKSSGHSYATPFSSNHTLLHHQNEKKTKQPCVSSPKAPLTANKTDAAKVGCGFCDRKFSTNTELSQHKRDKHKIDQQSVSGTFPGAGRASNGVNCPFCPRSFSTNDELSQHRKDKHQIIARQATVLPRHGIKSPVEHTTCSICSSHFSGTIALLQHMKDKHATKGNSSIPHPISTKQKSVNEEYKCKTCSKCFPTKSQLLQHRNDKHSTSEQKVSHSSTVDSGTKQERMRNERKKTIDEYYAKKVDIDKEEKKTSVRLVNDILSKIMSHVHGQKGGDIYCPNHVKAGSFPVNTKIGKPDEFDTNICLKLGPEDVKVSRNKKIKYNYPQSEHAANMNVKCDLDRTKAGVKVPHSYAVVSVEGDKIPEDLKHGNDLIPREMRYDLYQKIKTALGELKLTNVNLSRNAHGPALTMTIHPHRHHSIRHQISVDITISAPSDIPIMKWPRKETRQAFSEKLINEVKETGTHLVPKRDECWAVSYSKAERALFSSVDEGNGCRKFVYKMLKKFMQSCKSRSQNGLPGLSSHILKTQLLWSCERHTEPGYWHHTNRDVCLIDALGDLEKTLKSRHLPDYFDTRVDILESKGSTVCLELANYLHDKKCQLEQE